MATRAELFRYLQERVGWSRHVAADRAREPRPKRPDARGVSARAGKKAQYALESSEGRPSRKSTRSSANRQKTDVQFRMKSRVSEVRAQDRPRTTRG